MPAMGTQSVGNRRAMRSHGVCDALAMGITVSKQTRPGGEAMGDTDRRRALGQVLTPDWLVRDVLDVSGLGVGTSPYARVLEPSCGDGAFVTEIAHRKLEACDALGIGTDGKAGCVRDGIVGVEIDAGLCETARRRLAGEMARHGIGDDAAASVAREALRCGDALGIVPTLGRFDFVIGNPPYVRTHRIGRDGDTLPSWCGHGMTDLYIAFFQLGFDALADDGVLGYVAPSSWLGSVAGSAMRDELTRGRNIRRIVDFGSEKAFDATGTYVAIAVLSREPNDDGVRWLPYDAYDRMRERALAGDGAWETAPWDGMEASGRILLADEGTQRRFVGICRRGNSDIDVRNGYQTSWDGFFVRHGDGVFDDGILIPVVKASTGEHAQCVFPYDRDTLAPMPLDEVMRLAGDGGRRALMEARDRLASRDGVTGDGWYLFGRTQAIGDTNAHKVTVSGMMRTHDDLKVVDAPPGTGVYGGAYVIGMGIDEVRDALSDDAFDGYVRLLGRRKSGGYCAFSAGELRRYLNWWHATHTTREATGC
jgi:adenine-specific DNA-methyltransferase